MQEINTMDSGEGLYGEEFYGETAYGEVSDVEELPLRQGWHPFYIFPALYVLSPYLVMFLFGVITEPYQEVLEYCFYIPVVFGVVNIIACVNFCKPQNRIILLNSAVLVKCAMIPVFLFGAVFVMVAGLLSFIPVPFMIFVGPTLVVICFIIGWVLVAFGAPYALAYLNLSVKAGMRFKFVSVVHGLLQFFFVADVVDVMLLAVRERKWIKLCIGLVMGAIVLIILAIVGVADIIKDVVN